jgi:ABC-type Co2+ transport system permease subunit
MIDLFVSVVSLVSLMVFLLEARHGGGIRRRWLVALWSVFLFALSILTLLRVFHHLRTWSEGQILMGIIATANLTASAALLVGWLYWTGGRPTSRPR